MKTKGTKNDTSNRGVNTHDEDRTLVVTFGAGGRVASRRMVHIDGIRERLSKVASAPNGRRLMGKSK